MLPYTGGENKIGARELFDPSYKGEEEYKLLHEQEEDNKELVHESDLRRSYSLETELAMLKLAEENTKLVCAESVEELDTLRRMTVKARNPMEVERLYKRCRQWR